MRISFYSLLALLLLTGCRTYGGFDSEEALYAQIEKTNQQFEDELTRAKAELNLIRNAASSNRLFASFAAQYEEILSTHEAAVADHAALFESLEVKTGPIGRLTQSYRKLNRGLGAILAEQNQIRDSYVHLLNNINRVAKDDAYVPVTIPEEGRYQAVPPFYESIRFALESLSMEQAIQPALDG